MYNQELYAEPIIAQRTPSITLTTSYLRLLRKAQLLKQDYWISTKDDLKTQEC